MEAQRSVSRFTISEKAKAELMFVGQCVIAAVILGIAAHYLAG